MPTPIPITPESLGVLRARYPRALEYVYDQLEIARDGVIRPGEVASNVFDHEDGLRLLVSRERTPKGQVVLRVSASFPEQCRMADEMRLLAVATPKSRIMQMWLDGIPARFRELSGDARPLRFLGWSGRYIPHWILED